MINVAVTNLGKYNEGELVFKWLTLPAAEDEIADVMEEIGVAPGSEYEEYFISDYETELGVGISERDSIEALIDLAETLDGIEIPSEYDAGGLIGFAYELESLGLIGDASYYIGDIVSDDDLDEMTEYEAESGGWRRVAHFLAGIHYMGEDYYRINGYGNAENIEPGHLASVISDIMSEVKRNI